MNQGLRLHPFAHLRDAVKYLQKLILIHVAVRQHAQTVLLLLLLLRLQDGNSVNSLIGNDLINAVHAVFQLHQHLFVAGGNFLTNLFQISHGILLFLYLLRPPGYPRIRRVFCFLPCFFCCVFGAFCLVFYASCRVLTRSAAILTALPYISRAAVCLQLYAESGPKSMDFGPLFQA